MTVVLRAFLSYVVAAGGRIIIPPCTAAHELGGIYRIKYARGVDTREVKSYFDQPALWYRNSTSFAGVGAFQTRLKDLPSETRRCSNRKPPNRTGSPVSPQIDVFWPGNYCRRATGEGPIPDWKLA